MICVLLHRSTGRTRSIQKSFTTRHQYPEGSWHFQTKSATVNRRRKIAVLRQEFEEKYVSSKLHRVSKKLCQLIFCSFSVKYEPISIKNWKDCSRRNPSQNSAQNAHFTLSMCLHYLGKFEVSNSQIELLTQ